MVITHVKFHQKEVLEMKLGQSPESVFFNNLQKHLKKSAEQTLKIACTTRLDQNLARSYRDEA